MSAEVTAIAEGSAPARVASARWSAPSSTTCVQLEGWHLVCW